MKRWKDLLRYAQSSWHFSNRVVDQNSLDDSIKLQHSRSKSLPRPFTNGSIASLPSPTIQQPKHNAFESVTYRKGFKKIDVIFLKRMGSLHPFWEGPPPCIKRLDQGAKVFRRFTCDERHKRCDSLCFRSDSCEEELLILTNLGQFGVCYE